MAKKIFAIAEVDELEVQSKDGEVLATIKFDARANFRFNDFEDGINTFVKCKSQAEQCAMLVYIGAVENTPNMTMEKAREIASLCDLQTLSGIMNEYYDSIGVDKGELMQEIQKKTMQMFVNEIMK